MPSPTECDSPQDEERWDSSDPERAPPPLPLNPQSPSVSPRKGTSSAIQSAHAALAERARESNPPAVPLPKRHTEHETDKSLVKGTHHRRMRSQAGTVKDISFLLENGQASTPTPHGKLQERTTRPETPDRAADAFNDALSSGQESRSAVTSPTPGPSLTPIVRPTVRRPQQSILGENTPPQSATMLALQNSASQVSKEAETPLANVSNVSNDVVPPVRGPPNIDGLSSQILSLTNIATSLQKDIAQLSRRSRDNATDLLSLKEATNSRDEDIRKSLRDVITNFQETARPSSHDAWGTGLYLDNKPHQQPQGASPLTKAARPFSLPRIPSPISFAPSIDRDSSATPSLCSHEATSAIALLERIIKDMGTKEGNDSLLCRLSEISKQLTGVASTTKIDELIALVKKSSEQSRTSVSQLADSNSTSQPSTDSFGHATRGLEFDHGNEQSRAMTQRVASLLQNENGRRSSAPSAKASELINDDIVKVIRTIKDSVAQGGGLTAEVKALVRELRGEVLGMGREIGRRLDEAGGPAAVTDGVPSRDKISEVVEESLEQMKEQINEMVREHRRQSATSSSSRVTAVDYQEIYNAMRAALHDSQASQEASRALPELDREDILEAVRAAWESYKPEVEITDHGLGREDVLEYLKQGLRDYDQEETKTPGATRDEVFQAVVEGLKHFAPPRMDSEANLSRDEILEAVRECLEEFEFPVAPSAINAELTRDDMVHAVQEGLKSLDLHQFNAHDVPSISDHASSQLQVIMDSIRRGFEDVSEEAKQNVAANGRDTEQVLDATKDGLEKLRSDMEQYFSQLPNDDGQQPLQEGLMENLNLTLDEFRDEIAALVTKGTDESKDLIEERIDALRDTVNSSMVPVVPQAKQTDQTEILEAIRNGLDGVRADMHRPLAGHTEIMDALHEGIADLRVGLDKLSNRPMDLTANDEILDALKSGLDSVRSDIGALREQSREDKAVTAMNDTAVVPAETTDVLRHEDIENLEVLITQLRIKVEAMGPEAEAAPAKDSEPMGDLTRLEDMLSKVQDSVNAMAEGQTAKTVAPESTDPASREDVEAIETILRNTKARLDDLIEGEQMVRKEHINDLQTLVGGARESIDAVTSQFGSLPSKQDVASIETLVNELKTGLEDVRDRESKQLQDPERVTKTDTDAIEAACLETKALLNEKLDIDMASLATGVDIQAAHACIEELKEEVKARLDSVDETNAKASDERQAEIVGVGERVSDVKALFEEFNDLARGKLDDGATGIEALGKLLESVSENVEKNMSVGQDVKDLTETIKAEFEESKAGVAGAKIEADEKFQQINDGLGSKIDEKVAELLAKYEEFQTSAEERAKAGEARDLETESALIGTKTVAEELKILIDTLGSTVTDSLEKMEEASKTVFDKVEDLAVKTDEGHIEGKAEHRHTRDEIKLAAESVETLQGQFADYQPKIFEAVKDVLLAVGQHYEHSKSSIADIDNKIEATTAKAEPPLLPPTEKYDDTVINEKLDKLVDHTGVAGRAFSQLNTLEQVHRQVTETASEISAFLRDQTQKAAEAQEDKQKALQETTVSLERQTTQKEQVEANLISLREEEEDLKTTVMALRHEKETMTRQKTRLTADVSSLETALRLRREELQDMETRAEGLERRILEGVMDHSRVLLMSKAAKGQETMSRKRVKPQKPGDTAAPTSDHPPPKPNVPITLSAKRNLAPPSQNPSARRILSLSQINNNAVTTGVKRSQSVRTPAGAGRSVRKSSWGGGNMNNGRGKDDDKENTSIGGIDEEPETDSRGLVQLPQQLPVIAGSVADEDVDDSETLRRSSHGTTIITESMTDSTAIEGGDGSYVCSTDGETTENGGLGVDDTIMGNEVVVFGDAGA